MKSLIKLKQTCEVPKKIFFLPRSFFKNQGSMDLKKNWP